MSTDPYTSLFFLLSPAWFGLLYFLYVLLKPQNDQDKFFSLHSGLTESILLERISLIEKINQSSYPEAREEVRLIFADGKFSQREIENYQETITAVYFNGFWNRWIAFKKADIFLKAWYVYNIFFFVLILHHFILGHIELVTGADVSFWLAVLLNLIFFVLALLLALIVLGIFSMVYTLLSAVSPARGSIMRACIQTEEMIKMLKPGGRNTALIIKDKYKTAAQWPRR